MVDRSSSENHSDFKATASRGLEPIGGAEDASALVGQIVAERYRIEELVGQGGMGCVYRATHVHMRKTVALKTLHPELTRMPEVVARFEREAIAASRIEHINVASATDFGRLESGTFYLVLEYVEGESLRQRLTRTPRLAASLSLIIVRQIACALREAHSLGIVHRDLKPENIMLVRRTSGEELVKVLDFGIAKVPLEGSGSGLTSVGTVMGTPAYMAPEQCAAREADARSDLYSLGIILYEILNGRQPFRAADTLALLSRQLTSPPDPMESDVPAPLADLIVKLLEKEPDKRFQSAADLIVQIDALLEAASHGNARSQATGDIRRRLRLFLTGVTAIVDPVLQRLRLTANHPLSFARKSFRLWHMVGAALAVLVALGLWFGMRRHAENVKQEQGSGDSLLENSQLPRRTPDEFRRQVERVEMLKVYERTDTDWVLLARGYAELGQWQKCAQAYRSVLALRSDLRSDPLLLNDLRLAARDPEAFKTVLNLAETVLGADGVELIWVIASSMRSDADPTESEKLRKQLVIVSHRARPALRTAIELDYYRTCPALLGVVARAAKAADQRSVAALEALTKTSGCGPRQEFDCYSCLRSDDSLEKALSRARLTAAPALGAAQ